MLGKHVAGACTDMQGAPKSEANATPPQVMAVQVLHRHGEVFYHSPSLVRRMDGT